MTAEWLGMPFMGYARKVQIMDGSLRCDLVLEESEEVAEASLPAVVSVVSEVNSPRYPTLLQIMQASKKPMDEISLESLKDADFPQSRVGVVEIQAVSISRKRVVFEGTAAESSGKLVDFLRKEGLI
jgi:electron transfer flavoprotein beta subunit